MYKINLSLDVQVKKYCDPTVHQEYQPLPKKKAGLVKTWDPETTIQESIIEKPLYTKEGQSAGDFVVALDILKNVMCFI